MKTVDDFRQWNRKRMDAIADEIEELQHRLKELRSKLKQHDSADAMAFEFRREE